MLKRLLAALKGKKVPPPAYMQTQAPAEDPISAYDEYGRQVTIGREDWRQKVLLPQLRKQWNDPDALCGTLIPALNDGFAPDLVDAARRLVEIDADPERSHTLLGIVLLKTGQPAESRAVIEAGIAKVGRSGVLLTNLAKAVFEESGQEAAMRVLWQAVEQDPNLENGLMWWMAAERDRGGDAAYLQALRRVAVLPGSWRAQLWLARHALETGDVDAAVGYYHEVLASGGTTRDALLMISGDLGNHGRADLALALVEPVYDPTLHGPQAGMNLLLAMHQAGDFTRGEALLSRLYALDLPPYKVQLDQAAAAFQQLRQAHSPSTRIEGEVHISLREFTRPIWHGGLGDPVWLFAEKAQDAPRIGFSAFAMLGSNATHAESQREDDIGRLTRAIPLYLAESAHYWTGLAASTLLPVAAGAPVVFGAAEGPELFDRLPDTLRWYVSGEITCPAEESGQHAIALHLWNRASRERVATENETCRLQDIGAAVLRLEQALLRHLDDVRTRPLDEFYRRPSLPAMNAYLAGLGQSLVLTLVVNGVGGKSSLWGERAMLDWPLNMSLQSDEGEVARVMYLAGLGKAKDYGSDVLPEFAKRTMRLIQEAAPGSPSERLAPVAWAAFDMDAELAAYRAALPSAVEAPYRAWLEGLIAASAAKA
jgi:tetratricopeptide (TPR) repeat protein